MLTGGENRNGMGMSSLSLRFQCFNNRNTAAANTDVCLQSWLLSLAGISGISDLAEDRGPHAM